MFSQSNFYHDKLINNIYAQEKQQKNYIIFFYNVSSNEFI